jgi:hypothetical protein
MVTASLAALAASLAKATALVALALVKVSAARTAVFLVLATRDLTTTVALMLENFFVFRATVDPCPAVVNPLHRDLPTDVSLQAKRKKNTSSIKACVQSRDTYHPKALQTVEKCLLECCNFVETRRRRRMVVKVLSLHDGTRAILKYNRHRHHSVAYAK